MIRDVLRFLAFNLRHYALALWGVRLRLDPDYPPITRFWPSVLRDSVFEYRTYGVLPLWGLFLSMVLPAQGFVILLLVWMIQTWNRQKFFQTPLAYWKQAYRESPRKLRPMTQYAEQVMREIERQLKAGKSWGDLDRLNLEAMRLQDEIIQTQTPPMTPAVSPRPKRPTPPEPPRR